MPAMPTGLATMHAGKREEYRTETCKHGENAWLVEVDGMAAVFVGKLTCNETLISIHM